MPRLPRQAGIHLLAERIIGPGGEKIVMGDPAGEPPSQNIAAPSRLAPFFVADDPILDQFPRPLMGRIAAKRPQIPQPFEGVESLSPMPLALPGSQIARHRFPGKGEISRDDLGALCGGAGPGIGRRMAKGRGYSAGQTQMIEGQAENDGGQSRSRNAPGAMHGLTQIRASEQGHGVLSALTAWRNSLGDTPQAGGIESVHPALR